MASINTNLLKKCKPAERQFGLRFYEDFANLADVQENEGTVNGTVDISNGATMTNSVSNYISYPLQEFILGDKQGALRLIARASSASTIDDQVFAVGDDSSNYFLVAMQGNGTKKRLRFIFGLAATRNDFATGYIYDANIDYEIVVVSTGTAYVFYVNGAVITPTTLVGSNNGHWLGDISWSNPEIYVGAQKLGGGIAAGFGGTISTVQYFSKPLDATDILAYYNNTMYSYNDNLVCYYGMENRDHDPTNNRTLDRSGNRNHATFGDGSTASTFPDKLDKRGYYGDGSTGQYFEINGATLDSASEDFSINYLVKADTTVAVNTSYAISQSHTLTPYASDFITPFNGNLVWFRSNTAGSATRINDKRWHMVTIVWDHVASICYTYLDSIYAGATAVVTGNGGVGTIKIMSIGDASGPYFPGSISDVLLTKQKLSPIQIKDLYFKLLQEINRR